MCEKLLRLDTLVTGVVYDEMEMKSVQENYLIRSEISASCLRAENKFLLQSVWDNFFIHFQNLI